MKIDKQRNREDRKDNKDKEHDERRQERTGSMDGDENRARNRHKETETGARSGRGVDVSTYLENVARVSDDL